MGKVIKYIHTCDQCGKVRETINNFNAVAPDWWIAWRMGHSGWIIQLSLCSPQCISDYFSGGQFK